MKSEQEKSKSCLSLKKALGRRASPSFIFERVHASIRMNTLRQTELQKKRAGKEHKNNGSLNGPKRAKRPLPPEHDSPHHHTAPSLMLPTPKQAALLLGLPMAAGAAASVPAAASEAPA